MRKIGKHLILITLAILFTLTLSGAVSATPTPTLTQEPTILSLTISPSTIQAGQSVTLTATLIDSVNNGRVNNVPISFYDENNQFLGTATTDGQGVATLTIPYNSIGTHYIYAKFDGYTRGQLQYLASSSNSVTLTVTSVNHNPVAVNDAATTNQNTAATVNVVTNDNDPDHDSLSVTGVTPGTHGSVVNNHDGTVTYTPTSGYYGTDSFTYTISDGNGGTATGTVNVLVNGVPVANPDSVTTNQNTPVSITTSSLLANDSDLDNDPLTVTGVGSAAHGTVTLNSGTVTYTPTAGYSGSDSFTYTISDGKGGTATATVNINVRAVADIAVNTAFYDYGGGNPVTTAQVGDIVSARVLVTNNGPNTAYNVVVSDILGSGLNFNNVWYIKWNAADIGWWPNDGSFNPVTKTWTISSLPAGQTAMLDIMAQVMSAGTLQHSAQLDSSSLYDGNSANNYSTASITVPKIQTTVTVNSPSGYKGDTVDITATLVKQGTTTGIEGKTIYFTITGDPNTYTALTGPNGVATLHYPIGLNHGSYQITANNAEDNNYLSSIGHGTLTVLNHAPVAVGDSGSVAEDGSVDIPVLANDSDLDGDTLTVHIVSGPAHGSASVNADRTVHYVPDADYNGSDSFTYYLTDGNGGTSATVTVDITVSAVNDAPKAVDDSISTNEDTLVDIDVLANDTDVDAGDSLTVISVTPPGHGTASINPDGTVRYTPSANYNGPDSFTYTISDGHGGFATATVTITVTAVNDAPTVGNYDVTTPEDTSTGGTVVGSDVDSTLTFSLGTPASHGTVTVNPDGTWIYTPSKDYNGDDSFTVTVSDGTLTAISTVTIHVTPVNDAPVAVDDSAVVNEDTSVDIDVLANDADVDTGDSLTVSNVTQPNHGTASINPNGTVKYTPTANYHGTDSFTYTVSDGHGGTATATVNINVISVNDAPVANNDSTTTKVNKAVNIDVISNDSDVDGDPLTVTSVTPCVNGGSVVINQDGTVTYTPATGFVGTDSFTYTVSDGNEGISTATVTVTVVNQAPVAADDSKTIDENHAAAGQITASDVDGDSLTYTKGNGPAHGTATVNSITGAYTYTPNSNWYGTDSFTVIVSDGNGGSSIATVTITVNLVSINEVQNSTSDQSVPEANAVSKTRTIPLQHTGLPLAGFVLAALAIAGGLIPKRKN